LGNVQKGLLLTADKPKKCFGVRKKGKEEECAYLPCKFEIDLVDDILISL